MGLRVLHAVPGLNPESGGTTAAVVGMAVAQSQAGLQVRVLTTYPKKGSGTFDRKLADEGVCVSLIGPTHGPLCRHPSLRDEIDSQVLESDVIHVHGVWEEPQHLAVRSAYGRRAVVLSPHGMLDAWCLRQHWLKKQVYLAWRLRRSLRMVDALHVTTEEERQSLSRLGLPARLMTVPLGLDLSEFSPLPDRGRFRASHPSLGAAPYILFLSRLHPKKGLDLLLPAFAALGETHREYKLVIAGPASSRRYERRVRQQVDALGLGSQVVMPGMLHGVGRVEAMVDAEVFVLPSYQENFGIVVAEAGAAGLPLVVSDQVSLASFVRQHSLGIVTKQEVESLTSGLRAVLDDPRRRETGLRARAAVFHSFDWKQIGPRWAQLYTQLVESRGPLGHPITHIS